MLRVSYPKFGLVHARLPKDEGSFADSLGWDPFLPEEPYDEDDEDDEEDEAEESDETAERRREARRRQVTHHFNRREIPKGLNQLALLTEDGQAYFAIAMLEKSGPSGTYQNRVRFAHITPFKPLPFKRIDRVLAVARIRGNLNRPTGQPFAFARRDGFAA